VHAGDGTVNEAVNGLMSVDAGHRPLLAVVPGGSTNVFARAIGVDPDPTLATEQILEALAYHRTQRVSLGRADDRYFTFNAGLGIDAEVVRAVETNRAAGRTISNAMHVRELIKVYRSMDRSAGALRLDVPGIQPVTGAHFVFVSNVSPWTYLGRRPVRTNPGTSTEGGLGVFALRSLSALTVGRVGRELLRAQGNPRGRQVVRVDDAPSVAVHADKPLGFQADGDYLGERTSVVFTSIPRALTVVV
jgi:diacylglycerol kinase family enzyme